jgi:8-oxo-dGTP pyrophosphatase MutT (NUDIX family)
MTVQEQVDRAYRVAYRLAYPIVWCWWRLLKRQQGVVVAVWLDDAVLAVRHSYRPGLFLVHGGVGRCEDHRLAAARELQEEVGVAIDRDALRLVVAASTKLGLNYLYETRVTEKPELVVDRREIVEACFVHPGVLHEVRDQDKIGEYVRRHAGVGLGTNMDGL